MAVGIFQVNGGCTVIFQVEKFYDRVSRAFCPNGSNNALWFNGQIMRKVILAVNGKYNIAKCSG